MTAPKDGGPDAVSTHIEDCPYCLEPVAITKRFAEPWVRGWHPAKDGCQSFGKNCRGSGVVVTMLTERSKR